jgi:hypothetical protein
VDAVYPESAVSREFSAEVDQYVGASCKDPALATQIRTQLQQWLGLESRLGALFARSQLMKEAEPASGALSMSAKIAQIALEAITSGFSLSGDQNKSQSEALNGAEKQAHQSQLTLPMLPAFEKLVNAAGSGGACAR